jgi:coproporphyrinogen III oxidase-like Fe-S oxidoreductase
LNKIRKRGIIPDKIYIGGGTPSILNEDQLEKLLIKIQNNIKLENVTEFSFEGGRPDTLNTEKFNLLKKYGVNRISINPQIMKDETLRKLGRTHFSDDIKRSFNEARETGFEVINMDLIMGIEENYQDFFESLEQIIDLSPENITIHSLAFKRKSALNIDDKLIHSQERTDLFYEGLNRLRKAGYEPYYLYKQKLTAGGQENIGFARDKKYSSYNIQMIEERQSIFGFGVGASSKFVNPRDLTLENVFNPKDLYYYNDKLEEVIKKKKDFIEKLSKEYKYGIKKPKGTNDILPDEIGRWHRLEELLRESSKIYGYQEIRTPMFEHTELFVRGVGDTTDIVGKEMYTFMDKGERSITLRPEGTASVCRAFLENKMYGDGSVKKLYYMGPMFRYERPQKGRYKQFNQYGVEFLGSEEPVTDADIIKFAVFLLEKTGLKDLELHINSVGCPVCKPVYREALMKYFEDKKEKVFVLPVLRGWKRILLGYLIVKIKAVRKLQKMLQL